MYYPLVGAPLGTCDTPGVTKTAECGHPIVGAVQAYHLVAVFFGSYGDKKVMRHSTQSLAVLQKFDGNRAGKARAAVEAGNKDSDLSVVLAIREASCLAFGDAKLEHGLSKGLFRKSHQPVLRQFCFGRLVLCNS